MLVLVVAVAGGLGAVARSVVDRALQARTGGMLPIGTMTVNVVGSFVMGFVTGVLAFHGVGATAVAVVGTGSCGGFTTWSAYTWEAVRLLQERQHGAAAVSALGGLATSLGAAALGLALAAL